MIFPQRFIRHQRRCPGRDASTNISPQFGFSHSRIRERKSPVNRSIASRAIRESMAVAVAGERHACSKPSRVNCGGKSGNLAMRLIVSTTAAGGISCCRMACAARQMASRRESAVAKSSWLTGTLSRCRGEAENQSDRSEGVWKRSQWARLPVSPPVCVKSMHNLPATKINRAHSPCKMDPGFGFVCIVTTPV